MTTLNILLIDKRVSQYENIVAAVDPALAVGIVFDYYEDTFETIKTRMGEFGLTNITAVGLIQHNYRAPMFTMLASADVAPVAQVESQDPDLTAWTQFRDFIAWCKAEFNAAHFDLMACALYSDPDWKHVIDTLTAQTGVTVRASTDDTGAASMGGDWFLESHTGVNLKNVYFTEAIEEYKGILYVAPYDVQEYSTKGFAGGSVVAWGDSGQGGTGAPTSGTIVAVYGSNGAFAALKTDGTVVAWGSSAYGGSAPSTVTAANSGVVAVYVNGYAFAALKTDGRIVAWGSSAYGGSAPTSVTAANSGVVAVYSSNGAFAALKSDGSVVTWGNSTQGGAGAPNSVTAANSGVVAAYSTERAFAALKSDGSVVAWGDSNYGGTGVPSSVTDANSGVIAVYGNESSFAALKTDGTVVAWGPSSGGGSAPSTVTAANSGVIAVYFNRFAFVALKNNGGVVSWGDSYSGGNSPGAPGSITGANSGVVKVASTGYSFAALKTDGRIVSWGASSYGGNAPTSVTAVNSNVIEIYSSSGAFAALKSDGSVVTWGSSSFGGNSSSVGSSLQSGVIAVYSAYYTFAALKTDGAVVAWGDQSYGGTAPLSVTAANSGVVAAYNTLYAYATIKTDATSFDLSMSYYTNADRYDILRKKENRRRVNLTTLNNNVFTLSTARDIQSFNPTIPVGVPLRIIVPNYVSTSYSITSTATIPSTSPNVIIACDQGEHVTVTMSGTNTTFVNYGTFVYTVNASGSYVKTTTATINQVPYTLYGGDGINSSGIALLYPRTVPTLSSTTFSVASNKTFGDASFNITTAPTSDSSSAITYSSSNTAVATIDVSGNFINVVGGGTVYFIATQEGNEIYSGATKTSNTLTVARLTSDLSASTFAVETSKIFGGASFAITTRPTSNNTSVAIVYSSSNPAVATIDASGNFITLVGAGDVSFNATQAQTAQYESATKTSNTLTVYRGTTSLSSFSVAGSKTFGAAPFSITAPTSDSSGAITYSSNATSVATINASSGIITLVAAGTATFTASQAQSAQYEAPTPVTSNTLTVSRGTTSLTSFSVAGSKTFGAAPFSIDTVSMSDSSGAITYSSDASGVAIITSSSGIITLVAAGTATFTASQAQSAQYNAPTPVTSNTLTVSKVTPTLVFVNPPASKSLTDAAFTVTATSGILFSVSNSGSGAYVINGSSNPTLTVIRGMRYILSVNASGHPFWIQTVSGAYSGGNIYSNSSIVNNGEDVGNIIWEVAFDTPTTLYYACQYHSSMQGVINVV